MYRALHPYIGKICHVYLDNIIIWSQTLEEHIENIATVMKALSDDHLYCSAKKTRLFLTKFKFLGHIISRNGVCADPDKVATVKNWPRPTSATQMRKFLGLM